MENEKDAFYVVRKGDVVGIYSSLKDCQNQASSSVCNPPVSVFKGYGLPKEAVEHLACHGFQNASYTISASNVKDGLFGDLVTCPYQQPVSSAVKSVVNEHPPKRSRDQMEAPAVGYTGGYQDGLTPTFSGGQSCILEFDGASKGNPGPSGAGAVIRAESGRILYRVSKGVGFATNNVAEYRALILGLEFGLDKGYKYICVRGDSVVVCCQMEGTLIPKKNSKLAELYQVAERLKKRFRVFQIKHIFSKFNSDADALAKQAVDLPEGHYVEE